MEDIKIIEQPTGLDVSLYIHQLLSVYNMEKMEKDKHVISDNIKITTDIGINADMTGYGKTICMVALILRDKMEWDLNTFHTVENIETIGHGHIKKICSRSYPKIKTTLILAGTSIINQWVSELSHSNLTYASITSKKAALIVDPTEYDVLIVSPNMYNSLSRRLDNIAWKRFIYDEPTTVKCPSMAPIIAGFMWFVSATPDNIYITHRMSRKNYISTIIGNRNFEYNIRKSVTVKNDDEFVKQSFAMPKTHHIYHECSNVIYNAINGLVNNKIAKMVEAGYISGAVEALGGKATDNIMEIVKKNKNIELEEIKSKIIIWGLRGEEEKKKEWENREQLLLRQISELEKRFENMLKGNCSICYETIKQPIMEPSCQNLFCGNCLLSWLKEKNTCPLCRKDLKKEQLIYIKTSEDSKTKVNKDKKMTKEQIILKIINEKKDGKIILFSDWNDTFNLIRKTLSENNIEFIEIKGTAEVKTRKLEKFKSGQIKVLFLNSKIDSAGINLQETTDIILYHAMSDAIKTQIIGRANRIGRKQPLFVHHLLSN